MPASAFMVAPHEVAVGEGVDVELDSQGAVVVVGRGAAGARGGSEERPPFVLLRCVIARAACNRALDETTAAFSRQLGVEGEALRVLSAVEGDAPGELALELVMRSAVREAARKARGQIEPGSEVVLEDERELVLRLRGREGRGGGEGGGTRPGPAGEGQAGPSARGLRFTLVARRLDGVRWLRGAGDEPPEAGVADATARLPATRLADVRARAWAILGPPGRGRRRRRGPGDPLLDDACWLEIDFFLADARGGQPLPGATRHGARMRISDCEWKVAPRASGEILRALGEAAELELLAASRGGSGGREPAREDAASAEDWAGADRGPGDREAALAALDGRAWDDIEDPRGVGEGWGAASAGGGSSLAASVAPIWFRTRPDPDGWAPFWIAGSGGGGGGGGGESEDRDGGWGERAAGGSCWACVSVRAVFGSWSRRAACEAALRREAATPEALQAEVSWLSAEVAAEGAARAVDDAVLDAVAARVLEVRGGADADLARRAAGVWALREAERVRGHLCAGEPEPRAAEPAALLAARGERLEALARALLAVHDLAERLRLPLPPRDARPRLMDEAGPWLEDGREFDWAALATLHASDLRLQAVAGWMRARGKLDLRDHRGARATSAYEATRVRA